MIERLHHGGGSSLREVVAALEADMEAMYDMIDRFGGGNSTGGGDSGGGGGARNRETSNAMVPIFVSSAHHFLFPFVFVVFYFLFWIYIKVGLKYKLQKNLY